MDWLMLVTNLMGMWLLGNKNNKGNLVLLIGQTFWIFFAINVGSKPLICLSFVYVFIHIRNYLKWRKE